MRASRVSGNLILLFLNVGIILGMGLGYRNYRIDRYSLLAVGIVSLLVLNGMFFVVRVSESELPKARLRWLNRYVVWPIILLAAITVATELFCGK